MYLLNLKLTICLHIYIQKLKLKILSLQKLIEQLRAEIKEKTNTITELEEKLKVQVKIFVAAELNLTAILRSLTGKLPFYMFQKGKGDTPTQC